MPTQLAKLILESKKLSSYDAYVLGEHLRRIGEGASLVSICIGKKYNFFNSDSFTDDKIHVHRFNERFAEGVRESDGAIISIDRAAIDLQAGEGCVSSARERISDITDLTHWAPVTLYGLSGATYLLANFIKYNWGGSLYRVLGGEVVKTTTQEVYKPTAEELIHFGAYEQNDEAQQELLNQALVVALEHCSRGRKYKRGFLLRQLKTMGFSPKHISLAIEKGDISGLSTGSRGSSEKK